MIAVPPLLTLLTLTLTLFIHSFIHLLNAQCGQIEGEVRIIAESRLADGAGHGARYDPSTAACRYDGRAGRFDVAAKVFLPLRRASYSTSSLSRPASIILTK